MQRSHWSLCRLFSAAAGDIGAGIAGGGEESLLGQAHPTVLQLIHFQALARCLAGSSRARRHLNKRGSVTIKHQCSGSVSFWPPGSGSLHQKAKRE
jgi:hypothetical protein